MHNIKIIRKDPNYFTKKLNDRNVKVDLKVLLDLDKKNRELIQKKEKLEQEKKIITKKKDESKFSRSKEISNEIEEIEKILTKTKINIELIMDSLPNIALDEVPVGKNEKFNKEIKKTGKIPKFDFKPLSHDEIGHKLNSMDFNTASKVSGSRFVFLKGDLALLERAISNFMLDTHVKEFGYQEISPPLIVSDKTMFGTGQLPKFENDQFELMLKNGESERKFLIPTAEVVLTNIVRESNLQNNLDLFL